MREVSKNAYIEKLYNNGNHKTIKMKLIDANLSTHIYFNVENNDKDSKFKAGNQVRMSKYKNIFAKDHT